MGTRVWRALGIGSLIVILLAATLPVRAETPTAPPRPATETGTRIVVRLSAGMSPEALGPALNAASSLTLIDRIPQLNAYVFRVPNDFVAATLQALRHLPFVRYAEVDGRAHIAFSPNDPEFSLHQYAPQRIRADQAWDITHGSADVVVAVVDTGVDRGHPDLAGKVITGPDLVNDDNAPEDDNGHGTHVAGIIAAATNNGIGVAGIGYETRVLVIKVLNAYGSGYYSIIAEGIVYAVDHGARIVNLSLRGTLSSAVLEDAVNYAWEHNALVVAAAGNDGGEAPVYPAAYDHVLAVSATDWNDQWWTLSNRGDYVDLSAPGVGIYSTDWRGGAGPYASRSGTSMATPHVAATAALVLSVNPQLTNEELSRILTDTAVDLGAPGWDSNFGYGRIDALAAVTAARQAEPTTASIGDRVWVDGNGNGVQDPGEEGLAGVTVALYKADGTPVDQVTSDEEGHYLFPNVPEGRYYLHITPPAGYVLTRANVGPEPADSDADPTTGVTELFTVAAGEQQLDWDVGVIPQGVIGGLVWIDPNANGVKDATENTVVPNVPIHITGTDIIGQTVNQFVRTDETGMYHLGNLLPGTYRVEVPPRHNGYILTTEGVQTVTLNTDNLSRVRVNFGYIAPTNVTLLNFKAHTGPTLVKLIWMAQSSGNAPAFHVWRSTDGHTWTRISSEPVLPLWENGLLRYYRFVDAQPPAGTVYYRLSLNGYQVFGPWQVQIAGMWENTRHKRSFLPWLDF